MKAPKEIKTLAVSKFSYTSPLEIYENEFRNNERVFTGVAGVIFSVIFTLHSLPIYWLAMVTTYQTPLPVHFSLASCLIGVTVLLASITDLIRHNCKHLYCRNPPYIGYYKDHTPKDAHAEKEELYKKVDNSDFGIITFLSYPVLFFVFLCRKDKFVNTYTANLVHDKCIDLIPESKKIVWDCLIQKSKLESLEEQLSANIDKTTKSLTRLTNISDSILSANPITQKISDKLHEQVAQLAKLKGDASSEIKKIDAQLGNMKNKVSAINDYKAIIDGALLVEFNDFIIAEAKAVFTGFQNEIEARKSNILEIENNTMVFSKTIHEVPEVVMALKA